MENVEDQWNVGEPAELELSNVTGHVTVRGGDEPMIRMHARKHGRDRAVENTRIETEQDGNRVIIKTRPGPEGMGRLVNLGNNMCAVDYELTVPRDCRVEVHTVSGSIDVESLAAPVKLQTVSGPITVQAISAAASVSTVSGKIQGRQIAGTLSLHTTSGGTQIRESQLDGFTLHTVSGGAVLETPLTPGAHYYAKTVSGSVRVVVPANTGVTVQMKSVSGSVHTDLPAEITRSGRRSWQGRINGGGATLEMQSVSGSLHLENGGGEAPEVPPSPETTELLRALEAGELTVDDVLERLGASESRR